MCGVMLAIIIFVLGPFKFSITLNCFMCFPSYTNFIFGTVSYCSSSSSCSLAAASSCCWSLTSFSSFAAGFYCCSLACSSPLLFLRYLSISPVHIPYSASSCYTIKKQFHVCSAVFLKVHFVLLRRVLILRCIILKLYFSKMNLSFIDTFLKNFLKILWTGKDHLITSPGHINILLPHPVSFFSSCEMQG